MKLLRVGLSHCGHNNLTSMKRFLLGRVCEVAVESGLHRWMRAVIDMDDRCGPVSVGQRNGNDPVLVISVRDDSFAHTRLSMYGAILA